MKKIILSVISFLLLIFISIAYASGLSYKQKNKYNHLLNNVYSKLEKKYDNDYDKIVNKLNTILTKIEKIKKTKYDKLNDKTKDLLNLIENSLKKKIQYYNKIKNQIIILVISDKRCKDCGDINSIINAIKNSVPKLSNANFIKKDFSKIKNYVKTAGINALPAIIFKSNNIDPAINPYLIKLNNGEYSLNIGASFDPFAEICGNGIDDDNNGKTDCEDKACKSELNCAPKVNRPKAELYIMSYCPYGTQAQKGYLQVMDKLGKVADTEIHFVNYIMHGTKEGEQNLREYCIQKEQSDKFHNYLQCFLKAGDFEGCLNKANIDKKKLNNCVSQTKKEINYNDNVNDATRRFPLFDLETKNNNKYKVQGSPTFVLNGIKVNSVGRNAKAYADLICNSFKNKPKECNFNFDTTTYDPGFGFTSNGKPVSGGCGGN